MPARVIKTLDPDALERQWVRIARRFVPDPDSQAIYQDYYRMYRDPYPHSRDDRHAPVRLSDRA